MTITQSIDQQTHWNVSEFVRHETAMLDAGRVRDWLDLVTDDFRYRIPVTHTPDNPNRSSWSEDSFFVDESRESLATLWAQRYEEPNFSFAWGENPRQRTRRFVTNIRVSPGLTSDTLTVEANVILAFARQSDPVTLVSGGRIDVLRAVDGDYKLAARTIHLDQTVITTTHLRIII